MRRESRRRRRCRCLRVHRVFATQANRPDPAVVPWCSVCQSSVVFPSPNRTACQHTYHRRLVARYKSVLSGVLPLGTTRSIEGGELFLSLRGLNWDSSCRLKGLGRMVTAVESRLLLAYRPAIWIMRCLGSGTLIAGHGAVMFDASCLSVRSA